MSREDTSNELQSMYDIQFSQNDLALQKKWKEKLDEDERIKLQQQEQRGALSLGQEEPQEIVPHAAVQGENHSYTYNKNGKVKQATYAAIDHEPHVEHTMPTQAQRQLLNAASIGSSIDFMRSLGGHENGGIDVNSLVTAGKQLQVYAEANPQGLEKNIRFNEHYAVFCAAQHQKMAEYHQAHAEFFNHQAAQPGQNQDYFKKMHELAMKNMDVAKNDAAINMNIAQRWSEHGRVHELGQEHEPEHKIDLQNNGRPQMGGVHLTPTYALQNAVGGPTPKAPPSPSFSHAAGPTSTLASAIPPPPPQIPQAGARDTTPRKIMVINDPHVTGRGGPTKDLRVNGMPSGVASTLGLTTGGESSSDHAEDKQVVQTLQRQDTARKSPEADDLKATVRVKQKPKEAGQSVLQTTFSALDPKDFQALADAAHKSLDHASSGVPKRSTLPRPKSMESLYEAETHTSPGTLRRIKSQDNVRL